MRPVSRYGTVGLWASSAKSRFGMSELADIARQRWVPSQDRERFTVAGQGRQADGGQREMSRRREVFERLMSKAIPASQFPLGSQPGEGFVGYGSVPRQIREVDMGQPMMGWNEHELKPDERLMLAHLTKLGERERAAQSMGPQMPMGEGSMR